MHYYEALKMCVEYGSKITRTDWNGRDMYVYYTKGRKIPVERWVGDQPTDEEKQRGYVEIAGHFDMKNAQGIRIIGWLASQTDMASDQWIIYTPKSIRLYGTDWEDDEDDTSDHARNIYPNRD